MGYREVEKTWVVSDETDTEIVSIRASKGLPSGVVLTHSGGPSGTIHIKPWDMGDFISALNEAEDWLIAGQ